MGRSADSLACWAPWCSCSLSQVRHTGSGRRQLWARPPVSPKPEARVSTGIARNSSCRTMKAPRKRWEEFRLFESRRRPVDIAPALWPPLRGVSVNPFQSGARLTPRRARDRHRMQRCAFEPTRAQRFLTFVAHWSVEHLWERMIKRTISEPQVRYSFFTDFFPSQKSEC
jgi:hypothetical protein